MNNLSKLLNIVKRIHHTEASRTDILQDLASISEKELEEIEKIQFTEEQMLEIAGYAYGITGATLDTAKEDCKNYLITIQNRNNK